MIDELERILEQLNTRGTMYEPSSARRIMFGHMSNMYAGAIDATTCALQLRKLGTLGADGADLELETMANTLAQLVENGERPTLVLPELGLQVGPPDTDGVTYGPGDAGIVTEAEALERINEEPPTVEPAEQLTETQVAEAGKPAPAPTLEEPPA